MSREPDARVGVYVCHCGGNISDVVDVRRVAEMAGQLQGVVVARTHMFMCSDPGQQMIQEDIAKERLNRVVVASCSPRLHELTFRNALRRAGLNPYLYEHANIREQVSWVTHAHPDQATAKAVRLVAAAVAKACRLEPLEPIRVKARRHAVVVGGGVSGLKAARDLAASGLGVTLIERSPFLGGHVAQLDRLYPTNEVAGELLDPLVQEVVRHPSIQVMTNAEVVAARGYVGSFQLTVRRRPRGVTAPIPDLAAVQAACPMEVENEYDYGLSLRKAIYRPYDGCYPPLPAVDWQSCNRCGRCAGVAGGGIDLDLEPSVEQVDAGVIVVATGFEHYEPPLGEFGYGEFREVVTLPQLVRIMASQREGGTLRWNGRDVRSVALIHCVGSRQIGGVHRPREGEELHEYCSRVCCTATLQAADELRELYPGVDVFDFYRDIRTYGRGHEDYYERATRRGVLFFRYAPEDPPTVERADAGQGHPLVVRAKDRLTWGEEVEVPVDLVVLAVGMVPRRASELIDSLKLPVGSDGFLLEVHPKLRPVEVAVNGVLLAGTCQGPKDVTESAAAASASAAKAAALLARGYVELDPFAATITPEKCDGCGECLESCGYEGAILLRGDRAGGSKPVAEINPALCKGCGSCVAACRRGAVELKGWTLEQFDAMVDAICGEEPVGEGTR